MTRLDQPDDLPRIQPSLVPKTLNLTKSTEQLIDASNGTHLWADRFDGSLKDIFELQDQVAISIAGVIEPALQAAEIS